MRASRWFLPLLILAAVGLLSHCNGPGDGVPADHDPLWPEKVPKEVSFARDVKPLLEVQCLQCHDSKNAASSAGLNLETRQLAMTTGRRAPAIVPGDPKNSPLIQVLKYEDTHPTSMPPAPDKIWGVRLEILEKWIRDGADWPESDKLAPPTEWE